MKTAEEPEAERAGYTGHTQWYGLKQTEIYPEVQDKRPRGLYYALPRRKVRVRSESVG